MLKLYVLMTAHSYFTKIKSNYQISLSHHCFGPDINCSKLSQYITQKRHMSSYDGMNVVMQDFFNLLLSRWSAYSRILTLSLLLANSLNIR